MVSWSNDVAKFRLSGGYRSSSRCDRVVIATVIRNLIVFPTLGSLTVLRSGTSSLLLLLELRFGESSQLLSLNQGVPSSRVLIFGLSLWESSHFLLLELSLGALSYLLLLVLGGVVTFVAVGAGGVNAGCWYLEALSPLLLLGQGVSTPRPLLPKLHYMCTWSSSRY